jgi:hypothetical protein
MRDPGPQNRVHARNGPARILQKIRLYDLHSTDAVSKKLRGENLKVWAGPTKPVMSYVRFTFDSGHL